MGPSAIREAAFTPPTRNVNGLIQQSYADPDLTEKKLISTMLIPLSLITLMAHRAALKESRRDKWHIST